MTLSHHQEALLHLLKEAAKRHQTNEVIYKSEWLGYLPAGLYHWVEVNREEIKPDSPDTLQKDLSELTAFGALKEVKMVQLNDEDQHIYYMLSAE